MRFKIRWLVYLAVAGCAFLTLSLYVLPGIAPSAIHEQLSSFKLNYGWPSSLSSHKDSSTPSVHALWQQWSKVFEDARPLNVQGIHLRSRAGNIPPEDNDTDLRTEEPDRVINDKEDIEALKTAHAKFVNALNAQEPDHTVFNGSGIVMVGGGEYFGPAVVGITMLRRTGSTLPVEVFVADESEWEDEICNYYLPKLGAKCLVITDFLAVDKTLRKKDAPLSVLRRGEKKRGFEVTHYQLKSLAMLFSSFTHVLYLDSDSIPLVDPATDLFTQEPYTSTGLIIWPDFWIASESPKFYTIAGLPSFPTGLPRTSSEAGQLLINKSTNLKTLLLANYYNIYGPLYYYPLLSQGALGQGDKETFLAAALVLGGTWYRVSTAVKSVNRWVEGEYKGSGMVQHHPHDDLQKKQAQSSALSSDNTSTPDIVHGVRPAFLHANTPKMNAGHLVDEGDLMNGETRLRLWGSKEEQVAIFGEDIEAVVWGILVDSGCALQHVVREWKQRERLCERLGDFWKGLFEGV